VGALRVEVIGAELERVRRIPTDNLSAYDSFLRGMEYFFRLTKEANAQARQMFERAIELDPEYAEAYAGLGWTYLLEWAFQWSQDPRTLERGFELAQRAIALDDSLPQAHSLLGGVYQWKKQHEQAIAEGERAIALDPNYADSYVQLGMILDFAGRPEEALGLVEKATRLNPHYPAYYLFELGHAYYLMRRYEEAIATFKRHLTRNPNSLSTHTRLAVIYGELGREEEARAEAAEVLRISPNYSLEGVRQIVPYKDPADLERFLDGLRKAGLR
jgi:tetratricopeptide (TPR) repeat protein